MSEPLHLQGHDDHDDSGIGMSLLDEEPHVLAEAPCAHPDFSFTTG